MSQIILAQVNAKNMEILKLDGIEISEVRRDSNDSFLSIRLSDKSGNIIEVTKGGSYSDSIAVFIKAPPKTIKKFRVLGNFLGRIEIKEDYKTPEDAQHRFDSLQTVANNAGEETGLKIEEVTVTE